MTAEDLRDRILGSITSKTVTASILADDDGIVAGTTATGHEAARLGLSLETILDEGREVSKGHEIARLRGNPKQVLMAEDILIGLIAKPSGIATAARRAIEAAGDRPRIVCGAWKKIPLSAKEAFRHAAVVGGALPNIGPDPFVYLDKNYVELLGGIRSSLEAVAHLEGHLRVIQLKGRYSDIAVEAREAAESRANILHIDTGKPRDMEQVARELHRLGLREKVEIAFGGGVTLEDVPALKALDIDILCIGREIIDAPLLDVRLEVIGVSGDKT